jgi:VWFA-related protein
MPSEHKTKQESEPASQPDAVRERFIVLFLDDINAKDGQHANDLKQTLDAAERFVKEALQPGVRVGVFTASGEQTLDFTSDVGKLLETIRSVRPHVRLSESGCPTPYLAYSIVIRHDTEALGELKNVRNLDAKPFDAQCRLTTVTQAEETWRRARELSMETLESIGHVADHLGTMPGTRVLLVASSGFLTATLEQRREQIVGQALHAGIVINAPDSKGLHEWLDPRTKDVSPTAMGSQSTVVAGLAHNRFETVEMGLRVGAMNEPLAALAEGPGGIFFHDDNDLHAGFQELAAPPNVTYRLSCRLHMSSRMGATTS